MDVSFADAKPTKTHMILKKLVDCNKVHYVVSQNIDGLHMKSGLQRKYLAELHGNMFVDECNVCKGYASLFIHFIVTKGCCKRQINEGSTLKFTLKSCSLNDDENIVHGL